MIFPFLAVLTLYFLNVLKFTESQTTFYFNLYSVFDGIMPLIGSVIADGYVGRFRYASSILTLHLGSSFYVDKLYVVYFYRTLLYASLLYVFGKVVMAGISVFEAGSSIHPWADFVGITILTLAAGGLGPCIIPFGGDQFPAHQVRMITVFFSIYYTLRNLGYMFASYGMPILRG